MKHSFLKCVELLATAAAVCAAADLRALPEHFRPDPFGAILDGGKAFLDSVAITTPRGGYASFQLVAGGRGPYTLGLKVPAPLEADVFREWFHLTESDQRYRPDALVPVSLPYRSQIPAPDNRIENQTAQAFWVDLWVPAETRPGVYEASAALDTGVKIPIRITVLAAEFPAEDAVTIDHNSYGSGWIAQQYPAARAGAGAGFFQSDAFFGLIHAYHRIFYEHRGTFHQLGYGHGGKTGPEFAPALEGSGRAKRIASWSLFDRHYGPLLDGSAFAKTRRGPRPIPFVYLPINPDWPASFVSWGEPGYEAEFVNIVSEMERHFHEKNWTRTRFEMFFNHKKRYKAYPWDGDETRFPADLGYFKEYSRLLRKAVPTDSPVKFVFRADASWMMERQFKELAGIVNFWVVGGGMFSWYPGAARTLKERGDIVWHYSGPPEVSRVSSAITLFPLQAWMWGIDGYIHWLTVSAGDDPWFRFDGGGTALVYPGERFAIEGPIPSIRLKLQRNCVQDIALLARLPEASKTEVARRYNGTAPAQWWTPRPAFADTPPEQWTNGDIGQATRSFPDPDAAAWHNVRAYIYQHSQRAAAPRTVQPRTDEAVAAGTTLDDVARVASVMVDGDAARRIVTPRALEWLFKKDPRDPWIGSDNYDVDHAAFIQTKKTLMRLARLAGVPCDVNLWMPLPGNRVHVVIRNQHEISQFWTWGALYQDMFPPMKEVLETGRTVTVKQKPGYTSVLAPVRDSLGDIVGLVEVVTQARPDAHENVK